MTNEHYEIERKFLVKNLPNNLNTYPHKEFEQAYISRKPTIRIRKEQDEYVLTTKGSGSIKKIEYNLPISKKEYENLLDKTSGNIVKKTRYFIKIHDSLIAELDIYHEKLNGLITVEVEFPDITTCTNFIPPSWFGDDVSDQKKYKNTALSTIEEYTNEY